MTAYAQFKCICRNVTIQYYRKRMEPYETYLSCRTDKKCILLHILHEKTFYVYSTGSFY